MSFEKGVSAAVERCELCLQEWLMREASRNRLPDLALEPRGSTLVVYSRKVATTPIPLDWVLSNRASGRK